jgi:hypothetical protein
MKDLTEVIGMGWLSFIGDRDPTGAVLGLSAVQIGWSQLLIVLVRPWHEVMRPAFQ